MPILTFQAIVYLAAFSMEHRELIYQSAQGNEQAFKALYELFKGKVFNTTLSYLQDASEAEETTQDVFVEVWKSASKFEGKSSVSTWIYRIAVNKCLDRLRYKKRKKRFAFLQSLFNDETGELLYDSPHFDHPGILLENKETAAILFQAIDELPEQQKTAYILSYIEDIPQKEVAEIMKNTPKAIEALNRRAKANLKNQLEKLYPRRGE